MDELPAGGAQALGADLPLTLSVPDDPVTGLEDSAEFLDVDVDQLSRPGALVAAGGLKAQAAELPHPDAGENRRDRRERDPEQLRDLGAREAQATQGGYRLNSIVGCSVCDLLGGRGAIEQPELALGPVAGDPLGSGSLAGLADEGGGLDRPALLNDPPHQALAINQAESSVSVKLHPVFLLGAGGLDTPSLQGGPDEQRG